MPKFRKLPVVIDAVRLRWDTWNDVCALFGVFQGATVGCYIHLDDEGKPFGSDKPTNEIGMKIETLNGVVLVRENEWICKGVNGEFYPCAPDIFTKTYESTE